MGFALLFSLKMDLLIFRLDMPFLKMISDFNETDPVFITLRLPFQRDCPFK